MNPTEKTKNGTEPELKESTEKPEENERAKETQPGATIMPPAD